MKQLFTILLLFVCNILAAQNAKQIQDAMNNYDYEKAIQLIEKEKPTPELLFLKGKALRSLSRYKEALKVFSQVIEQDTLNPTTYIEAAECCKQLAKGKEALRYYQKAIDIKPDNKYARLQYISLLCSQQQFQEAFGESSLLAESDSSLVVLHLQAQSLEGMNDMQDAAVGCYHVIQDKYPDDYLAAAKLGNIYNATGDYGYAIEATERYRQIDTTNIFVNRQNAQAYCLANDYKKAIKRYEYLVNQGDSSYYTCYYLGISYYALEKYFEAHDILEIARKSDPQNVNLLYYLGRSCSKTSWKKEGIQYLEDAIKYITPKDSLMSRLYMGMADCYKMAGMFKEQLATLQKRYYDYDKENHKLLYDMASINFYKLKNVKAAESCLETFLKTRPKEPVKEKKQTDMNNLGLTINNYYNAAEAWLKDVKDRKKADDFFQGKNIESPAKRLQGDE